MKFYVYSLKDKNNKVAKVFYVQDVLNFANLEYTPGQTEFNGLVIEAENATEAHRIWQNPQTKDEIFSCDEPIFTKIKNKEFKAKSKIIDHEIDSTVENSNISTIKLLINTYSACVAKDLLTVDQNLSRLASYIRMATKENPEVSTEDIYKSLKKKFLDKFNAISKFRNPFKS